MKQLRYWLRAEVDGVKTRKQIQGLFDAAGKSHIRVCQDLEKYEEWGEFQTSFRLQVDVDASVCESPYPSQASLELGMKDEDICALAWIPGIEGPRMPDSPVVRWAK